MKADACHFPKIWLFVGMIKLRLMCVAMMALLVGCAPFPVPPSWPLTLRRDVTLASPVLATLRPPLPWSELSKAEQTLLTFLADAARVKEAVGVQRAYGPEVWRVVEIFRLIPGQRWSVLCEDGHDQEALYFEYDSSEAMWYRVEHFDGENPVRHPALKLAGRDLAGKRH